MSDKMRALHSWSHMPLWPGAMVAGKTKHGLTDVMPMAMAGNDQIIDAAAPMMTQAAGQLGTTGVSALGDYLSSLGLGETLGNAGGAIGGIFGPEAAAVGKGIGEGVGSLAGTGASSVGKFMTDNAGQIGSQIGQMAVPAAKQMARTGFSGAIQGLDAMQNFGGVDDPHPEAERGRRLRSMLASLPMDRSQRMGTPPPSSGMGPPIERAPQMVPMGAGPYQPQQPVAPGTFLDAQLTGNQRGSWEDIQREADRLAAVKPPTRPTPVQRMPSDLYDNLGRRNPRY